MAAAAFEAAGFGAAAFEEAALLRDVGALKKSSDESADSSGVAWRTSLNSSGVGVGFLGLGVGMTVTLADDEYFLPSYHMPEAAGKGLISPSLVNPEVLW